MILTLVLLSIGALLFLVIAYNVVQQYKQKAEADKRHAVARHKTVADETEEVLLNVNLVPFSKNMVLLLQHRILDAYRNRSYTKVSGRAGTGSGLTYNREHTWPNSLGFASTTGDKGLPYAPYTDTHMLYLTDAQWNADRGNKPFGKCDANCGERATEANNGQGGGSGGYPGNSNWVRTPDGNTGTFEVWGKRKGDMARAVMYMAIRYEGGKDAATGQSEPDLELTDDRSKIVKTSSSPAYMGLLSTLIDWHLADPPSAAERARNDVIYSFQGNRNPFIDHPEWATPALFTSAKPATCQLAN